jgi:hypothetical protein
MNDVETRAKQARTLLAKALGLLQGAAAAQQLRPNAELVARGMGLLHQLERHPEQAASRAEIEQLLAVLRDALSSLQITSKTQPGAQAAIESAAAALGIVHGLHQGDWKPAVASRGARPAVGVETLSLLHPRAKPAGTKKRAQRGSAPAFGVLTQPTKAPGAKPAGDHVSAHTDEPKAPEPNAHEPKVQDAARAWPAAQRRKASPERRSLRSQNDDPFSIEASLGANSSSNFYKGLGADGVLEAGGIFVATHRIPPIGKPVTLNVHLPGGYQFQARGIVTWTRETSATVSEGLDAPPGFGARFTEISPQGRELVNRYAANREPLFHDT